MVLISLPKRRQRSAMSMLLGLACIFLPLLLVSCGNSGSGTSTTTSNALPCSSAPNESVATPTPYPAVTNLAPPQGLIAQGTLTIGSDTTYPPQEFINTNNGTPTGFDVDLITAMAQKLGLQAKVVSAGFDTILDGLNAKRFDTVISAITINSDRLQKADFIPYFLAGESLIVPKGNPLHITCVPGLCGLKVGVQSGTVEQSELNAQNTACTQAKKPAIQLTVLQNQTDVIQLLVNHRVDATYQDSPVSDLYIKQNAGQFEIGGTVVNAAAEGIAVRQDDSSLLMALRAAFSAVKSDGTYDRLFQKWELNAGEKIAS